MVRSWLFAPGHSERILARVFDAGADEALLDLEDAVAADQKARARGLVAEALASHPAWVRVNRPGTDLCAADLAAVAGLARGLRLPKVESPADVAWVRERLDGRELPLTASIESAPGVLRAGDIAAAPGVGSLAFGNVDFGLELHVDPADVLATLYARSHLVLASRAAGIEPPSDGVWARFRDLDGLRAEARLARRLGFFGKSAIHPDQVPVINEVFSPTAEELDWARRVVAAFEASGGAATRLDDGEMVDVPVAERARRMLEDSLPLKDSLKDSLPP
jgi:citrate lyase subunit beta / citryl-CoA lyase